MALRKFAEDSSVPVDRTRGEITKLLQEWGCSALGWTDHFAEHDVELGFVWDPSVVERAGKKPAYCPKGGHYGRMTCEEHGWKNGYAAGSGNMFRVRMRVKVGTDPQKQRTAHRLLLLKIKADLNAAQAGLAKAEEVFLPYIVDGHGHTFAEKMLPHLHHVALPPAGGTGGNS